MTCYLSADSSHLLAGTFRTLREYRCAVAVVGATTDDGVIRGRYLFLQNEQGKTVIAAGADDDSNGVLRVTKSPREKDASGNEGNA